MQFTDYSMALDLFTKYLTDKVWDLLITETNRYAHANTSIRLQSRAWNDVCVEGMKAFIGMLILLGIIKLPRLPFKGRLSFKQHKTNEMGNNGFCTK